jgi:hypothetical protein
MVEQFQGWLAQGTFAGQSQADFRRRVAAAGI